MAHPPKAQERLFEQSQQGDSYAQGSAAGKRLGWVLVLTGFVTEPKRSENAGRCVGRRHVEFVPMEYRVYRLLATSHAT